MGRSLKTLALGLIAGLTILAVVAIARAEPENPAEEIRNVLDQILERLDRTPPTWDISIHGPDRFKGVFELQLCRDPSSSIDPKAPPADPICDPPQATAVLDRETGLVWERYVAESQRLNWFDAQRVCHNRRSLRRGWRLPRAEELASLLEITRTAPALPAGHPFLNERARALSGAPVWSATSDPGDPSQALVVSFVSADDPIRSFAKQSASGALWCVRGGHG